MSNDGLAAACEEVMLRRIANAAGRTERTRRRIDLDILGRLIELTGFQSLGLGNAFAPKPRGFYPPVGFKYRNQR